MKKFFYPIIFSVGFMVFWSASVGLLNASSPAGDYGALGIGILGLFAWLIVSIPIHGIRYSKLVIEEKFSYLFELYNCVLIIVSHLVLFNFWDEILIIVCFSLWVIFWCFFPLTWRILSRKYELTHPDNEIDEQSDLEE